MIPITTKIRNVLRGLTKRWGPSSFKRKLWDKEYARGNWDHCENTADDEVYGFVEKYCRNGSILDLGCGSGNTGNELALSSYRSYTGVDISHVAVDKAARRSEKAGRADKNQYLQSDILLFVPQQQHDVILFRESINNVPQLKLKATLLRYSQYLTDSGVFVVRISNDATRIFAEIAAWLEGNFRVVEKFSTPRTSGAFIMVFR